ncbi:MAG: outer membrane beta-barrel protein [Bacteroidia bacterium]|nr:outer membrane beta-barrel protein [Bacteroidia bacterium]
MRKKLFVFLFALSPVFMYAQEKISLNFAQVFSGFRFKDSQGNEDEYLSRDIKYSYAVNYEKVFSPGFYFKPEIGYKNFGAKSNVDNTKIDWNLHYLDFNLGGGYLYKQHKIKPYIGAAFYFAYMYKGDQTIGSDSYDLLKLKALSTTDYGIDLDLGVRYDFSESSSVFIELCKKKLQNENI